MAMILDAFVPVLGRMVAHAVKAKLDMLLSVPADVEKLEAILKDLGNILGDAERKRITDMAVDGWVRELKDIMYDADDFLDRWLMEVRTRSSHGPKRFSSSGAGCCVPVRTCFRDPVFTHDMAEQIKKLNRRLESVCKRSSAFGFVKDSSSAYLPQRAPEAAKTSWVLVHADLVGEKVEEDAVTLVEALTSEDHRENVLVLAITGAGGIGKTTLAKRVFGDQRVRDEFDLRLWVCVSQEVNEADLLWSVIAGAGGGDQLYGAAADKSSLEPMLQRAVSGKKVLLVMDDVWSHEAWNAMLRGAFMAGARGGSRVLVTTRNEMVARQMMAKYIHRVEKLQPEDGWKLLKKHVMLGDDPVDIEFLKDIGMKIVTRCDCLPLAIKTVGGLLCKREKQTPRDWLEVSDSAAWSMAGLPEEVHNAIYLSYADLPSQLKQCFLHCSLFPKDEVIKRVDVVQMWIAEGFIQEDENGTLLEDIGTLYYKELITQNLLDPNYQFYDQSGCTMHDILRSFAHYLSKDEAAVLAQGQSLCNKNTKTKLRRISMTTEDVHPSTFRDEKQLRALMLFRSTKIQLDNFLHDLPKLRVLHLGGTNVKTLPPSLCDLRHLRYLELSGTMIDTIPNSIGKLKYLQYIGLINCVNLSILPGSIVKLQKLRALHIMGTKVSEMPKGIGRLENLVELTGFLTQNDETVDWNSLEELGHLSQLSLLYLNNLEKACSGSIAKKAKLQTKTHLRYLSLECTTGHDDGSQVGEITSEEKYRIEDVFEALCPPHCVENLSLVGFFGKQLPIWISSAQALMNLKTLKLENCIYCEQLPAFGHLRTLEFLIIKNAPSVMRIGHEFLCTSNGTLMEHQMSLFPRLEKLGFDQLDGWEEWIWDKGFYEAMPKILSLKITKCKLSSLPPGLLHHAKALRELIISEACHLTAITNFLSLTELHLYASPNLEMLAKLPRLRRLTVIQCPKLSVLEGFTELQSVTLQDYDAETLPQYLYGIKAAKLEVFCNKDLINLISLQEGPEWYKIMHIQHVKIYAPKEEERRGWYVLYNKEPFSLTTNVDGRETIEMTTA